MALLAGPAQATQPVAVPGYVLEPVAVQLPQATPTAVARSDDGELLIATFGGLASFDGLNTRVFDATRVPGMRSVRFSAAVAAPGGVWAGTETGDLWRHSDGGLQAMPGPGRPVGIVWDLVATSEGLWMASDGGAFHRDLGGHWEVLDGATTQAVAPLPDGTVVLVQDRTLYRLAGGRREVLASECFDVAVDPRGTPWAACGVGLVRFDGSRPVVVDPRAARYVAFLDGAPWVSLRDAIWTPSMPQAMPLPDSARSFATDGEGGLWVGLQGEGLWRVRRTPLLHLPVQDARALWPHPDGGWWVGRGCRGLVHLTLDGLQGPVRFPGQCVTSLAEVGGDLWVAVDAVVGVLDGDGLRGPVDVARHGAVLAIGPDARWVGTLKGLIDRETVEAVEGLQGPVAVIRRAPDGTLWAGGLGWVARLTEAGWEPLRASQGIPAVEVRDLAFVGDAVWVGTYGAGLLRVRGGRAESLGTSQGLVENIVSRVVADGDGYLWLSGNQGLSRVAVGELEAALAGERAVVVRHFDVGEASGGQQPSAFLHDGWLALLQLTELVAVPLRDLPEPPPMGPALRWQEVSFDGLAVDEDRRAVSHGDGGLRARFTAGSLSDATRMRFQWRLDDGPSRDLAQQHELTLATLPPGRHTVSVRALSPDGVPGPWRALHLERRPPLHETPLFRFLLLAGLMSVAFFAHRYRAAALAQRAAELEGLLAAKREAEGALRQSEAHYRSVFRATADGLLLVDPDGFVVQCNPAAEALFGGDATGSLFADRVPSGAADAPWRWCVRTDGSRFRASVAELPVGEGTRIAAVSDLEAVLTAEALERQQMERQGRFERLEAVGRLAARVAHDVNNLLGLVKGIAEGLEQEVDGVEARRMLADLHAGVDRGARLTGELLAFGRQRSVERSALELVAHLRERWGLLQQAAGDVTLGRVGEGPVWVHVDAAQLDVSLVNLLLNAAAAGARRIVVEVSERGGTARLEVRDDGQGMAPETLARAAEPFFTTRADGTGLGLASVQGFVHDAGGSMHITSTLGLGTSIVLEVPARRPPDGSLPPRVGLIRVLLVDDERPLLRAAARALTSEGMEVSTAGSAEEAMEVLRAADGAIDVLVTDVQMPGTGGVALYEQVRRRWPGLPVAFVSGFAAEAATLPAPVLAKPFGGRDLGRFVRRMLTADQPPDTVS